MTGEEFLKEIDDPELSMFERAMAVLWWASRDEPTRGLSARQICDLIENSGHPRQNVTRLDASLRADKRVVRGKSCPSGRDA